VTVPGGVGDGDPLDRDSAAVFAKVLDDRVSWDDVERRRDAPPGDASRRTMRDVRF
jgi:hypothetical protein